MNDIVIGEGEKGNSAILVRNVGALHIAQNSVCYWITGAFLDTRLAVFKNTEDGEELLNLLDDHCSDEELSEFMDELVLDHISYDMLKDRIINAIREGYEEGRRAQAALIRKELFHGM